MSRKCIVHFSQDFREGKPQLGGYTRIFNETADGKNRHILFTFHFNNSETKFRNENHLEVYSIGIGVNSLSWKTKIRVKRHITKEIIKVIESLDQSIDLIFGHSQLFNFDILVKVANKTNTKFIWEANTIWGINEAKGTVQKLIKWRSFFRMKKLVKRVDLLIAQTSNSKESILTHFPVQSDKVEVITNAVAMDRIGESQVRSFVSPLQVLCFGLFDTMNGIPFLVDSLPRINRKKFNITFIGAGQHVKQVEDAARNGLCAYKEPLPYKEMLNYLKKVDIVIIPRLACLEAHNFIPTKLLEAMACKAIIVGSDVKGIAEVVKHKETGFIFEAGNQSSFINLLNFIENLSSKNLQNISENAHKLIENKYTWQAKHKELLLIYEHVCN